MRVAHVPATHPFVRSIDPDPIAIDSPWSVSAAVEAHLDAVHVHFGFEDVDAAFLTSWIDDVHRAGIAVVHTVHDIDNPHLVDQSEHHLRTAALVTGADAVSTLTEAAADDIARRFGRTPVVVPHPPIRARPAGPTTEPPGATGVERPALLWLGTVRPNIDLEASIRLLHDADFPIDVFVRTDGWDRLDHGTQRRLLDASPATIRPRERPDDGGLEDLISSSSVVVLPYSWGTHSGVVELATDLGVATVTTDTGCRADQGALATDSRRLARAVRAVLDGSVVPPRRSTGSELETVRERHRELYASAVEHLAADLATVVR